MSKSSGSSESSGPTSEISVLLKLRLKGVLLLFLLALAIFLLVALGTYHPTDRGWSHSAQTLGGPANAVGLWGAIISDFILSLSGFFGYFVPFVLALGVWVVYQQEAKQKHVHWMHLVQILGIVLLWVSGSALAALLLGSHGVYLPQGPGGIIGTMTLQVLLPDLNKLGVFIALTTCFFIGMTLFSGLQWLSIFQKLGLGILYWGLFFKNIFLKIKTKWNEGREARVFKKQQRIEAKAAALALKHSSAQAQSKSPVFFKNQEPLISNLFSRPKVFQEENNVFEQTEDFDEPERLPVRVTDPFAESGEQMDLAIPSPKLSRVKPEKSTGHPVAESTKESHEGISGHAKKLFKGKIPSADLLDDPEENSAPIPEQALAHMACLLEEKLVDFGITAKVVGVCPGPVVTRYELQLAPGMKVSKLSNLSKDLARSLSAISVRIVEVIPGKSVVGIEIPNEKRQIVRLKEVLKSKAFIQSKAPLTMGLGKDISGEAEVVNLEKMPHLLVAGTTGSGKSVGLNAMLLSMLLKSTPNELRMIMIDPKMLELSIYEGIPHLLTPVVTDMKEAANALRWCVKEMDRRYRLMAALAVRNLAGYNQKVIDAAKAKEPIEDPIFKQLNPGAAEVPVLEPMPCIVVLVDEFADMMMVVGKKVEELIARLAQKARAAGIHLILATQRPSVDVITGLIKANIPTRMAFQVSSKIDSRTILDQQGAEQLLGHGDMLYLPPGAGVPTRVHGAFVSDQEVQRIVKAWKELGTPDYIESILQTTSSDDAALGESEEEGDYEQDPFYDEAVNLVIESGRASISMVQRRLKIGYNRSARLLDAMELAGLVSEVQPNGMRELLVSRQ